MKKRWFFEEISGKKYTFWMRFLEKEQNLCMKFLEKYYYDVSGKKKQEVLMIFIEKDKRLLMRILEMGQKHC